VALGKYVAQTLIKIGMPVEFNPKFSTIRKGIPRFHELSRDEQDSLIKQNPLYGKIICRCETVTEGEIVDAIHRPIPAKTMDAIKRRLRPGTGRCQGGFCGPRIVEILARELGIPVTEVNKNQSDSYMITGKVR
jgi:glycerol-3-phosphate dehydrogenase